MSLPTRYAVGLAAAAALLAGGCGGQGSAEKEPAGAAATAFVGALAGDPAAACRMLAPDTRQELEDTEGPCPQSLSTQDLPAASSVRAVEVYGKDAIVRLGQDTLFLARFGDGWRVTAAGCTPREDRPYRCTLKGS